MSDIKWRLQCKHQVGEQIVTMLRKKEGSGTKGLADLTYPLESKREFEDTKQASGE
jgi:hypothetical protein